MGESAYKSYEMAREKYAGHEVDTDKVIDKLKKISFAVHSWQADDLLSEYEDNKQFFARLGMMENLKTMPYGDVWNHYCMMEEVPSDGEWIDEVFKYEKMLF